MNGDRAAELEQLINGWHPAVSDAPRPPRPTSPTLELPDGLRQRGHFWALLWTLGCPEADPTVWLREYDEPPVAEQEPLSGFPIQFSLCEAAMGADHLELRNRLTARQVERLTERLLGGRHPPQRRGHKDLPGVTTHSPFVPQ
ncbi:hypothetical protein [Streptomyces sp. NPDC001435]|uniref:hypothetical protein n=1 Tax=unclassified Streptomyces TaxID=2593676 RepID=UPI0036A6575C